MDTFDGVSIVKKANVYFDVKVSSRTVLFADGTRKTLGFMLPGTYEFGTDAPELMEVIGGEMEVLLPGESAWQTIAEGASFSVPGKASFQVKVSEFADYCCSYLAGE